MEFFLFVDVLTIIRSFRMRSNDPKINMAGVLALVLILSHRTTLIKTRRAGNSLRKRTSAPSVYDLITIRYAHLGGLVKESIDGIERVSCEHIILRDPGN